MKAEHIRTQFAAARARGLRAREAAEALALSEGVAVAAHVGVHEHPLRAVPLHDRWLQLLRSLEPCGPLLALTRNDSVVHEKTGVYKKLSASGHVGLALGEDIDLRLFFDQWHAGYAVSEAAAGSRPARTSLQFFDRQGVAVHKIFPCEQTLQIDWELAINQAIDPGRVIDFVASVGKPDVASTPVDGDAFVKAWGAMTDTHQFFPLLRKFGLARQPSFRLVEGRYTHRVQMAAVRETLLAAALDGTPIMVFVGSPGCIQIHSGPVQRIKTMQVQDKTWLNVLDPGFNLHLREDLIDAVWVVEKPTSDGVVTSLEAFDARGELMAMFFGARKPGQPERVAWRHILAQLQSRGQRSDALAAVRSASQPDDGLRRRALLRAASAPALGALGLGSARAQARAGRLVSVGGGITEVVFALGAQDQLVGTDTTSLYPLAAQATPKVGYMRQLSAEGLLALRPDALIASTDAGPPVVLDQVRSAGVRLELVHSDNTWDEVGRKVAAVGRATGREVAARALQGRLDARWQSVQARVQAHRSFAAGPGPKVLFVLSHTGSMLVSGEQTAADAVIRFMGARNALGGFAGFRPMTAEAIAQAAPDVILTTTQGLQAVGGEAEFWQRPELALTPAYRRRARALALVHMDALEMLGFGPRLPEAIERLHEQVVLS